MQSTDIVIRPATRGDIPAIVALLADDPLGRSRERPDQPEAYRRAFDDIAAQSGNNAIIYSPTTSGNVVEEVLKSTISIPPTVTKAQGDRIEVLVARDLDFRSVYELRTVGTR